MFTQRRQVEEEFAELLAEYGEEEIGELEDPAEEDAPTKGQLEVCGGVCCFVWVVVGIGVRGGRRAVGFRGLSSDGGF